ncbi:TPA: hypothetical protein U5D84_002940 [Yersinia enterocolitica]|nr:hypothetical protein [Yersinia enterocolitica]
MCKKCGWPNLVLAGAAAKDTAQQWIKSVPGYFSTSGGGGILKVPTARRIFL